MLVTVSQTTFCRFFKYLKSNGAKLQTMVLSSILIFSSLVFQQCFLNLNLPMLPISRFVIDCGCPILKRGTIIANNEVKIHKKKN